MEPNRGNPRSSEIFPAPLLVRQMSFLLVCSCTEIRMTVVQAMAMTITTFWQSFLPPGLQKKAENLPRASQNGSGRDFQFVDEILTAMRCYEFPHIPVLFPSFPPFPSFPSFPSLRQSGHDLQLHVIQLLSQRQEPVGGDMLTLEINRVLHV